jgi:hypothetical protein
VKFIRSNFRQAAQLAHCWRIFHTVHIRAIILGSLLFGGLYGIRKKSGTLIVVVAARLFARVLLAAVLKQYPIVTRLVMFTVLILHFCC